MAKLGRSLGFDLDTQNIMYYKYGADHFIKDMEELAGVPYIVTIPLMAKSGLLNALRLRDDLYALESWVKQEITFLNSKASRPLSARKKGYLSAMHFILAQIKKSTKADRYKLPRKSSRKLKHQLGNIFLSSE